MPLKKVIETKKLSRIFKNGEIEVRALTDVDMIINEGEFVAIMGASGSGKSTLLHIIGCLDTPSDGEYFLNSKLVNNLDDDELARIKLGLENISVKLTQSTEELFQVIEEHTQNSVSFYEFVEDINSNFNNGFNQRIHCF